MFKNQRIMSIMILHSKKDKKMKKINIALVIAGTAALFFGHFVVGSIALTAGLVPVIFKELGLTNTKVSVK